MLRLILRRRVTGPSRSVLSGSQVLRAVTATKAVEQPGVGDQTEKPVSGEGYKQRIQGEVAGEVKLRLLLCSYWIAATHEISFLLPQFCDFHSSLPGNGEALPCPRLWMRKLHAYMTRD